MSFKAFLHEPLQFTNARPVRLALQPFRDYNIPKASIRIGMKRSGKGVTMDKDVAKYYGEFFTCIWLHSAGGFENLYTVVNKDCREKYTNIKKIMKLFVESEGSRLSRRFINDSMPLPQTELEMLLGAMKNSNFIYYDENIVEAKKLGYDMYNKKLLTCDCHGTIDTIWMHPDYIQINQKSLDYFNGYYFKTFEEYNDAYIKCKVNEFLPEWFDFKQNMIKKPKSMTDRIRPVLLTMPFTPPSTPSKVDNFRRQIREIVLLGRSDHRLVTNTASSFPETHQGKLDKYRTAAEFINYIPELVQSDFQKLKLNKPRSDWTPKEKAHWKLALFLGEVRELAPSSQLSPDPESADSKRALYGFMPKSRHNQTWVFMDLQSSADMFKGVKQQNDIFIIKRSTERILGEEFEWFYHKINKIRSQKIKARGYEENYIPPLFLERLNRKLPMVDEIPDNKGYIIFPNDEFKLVRFEMQRWHHKTESDNFQEDTGIQWSITVPTQDEVVSGKKQKSIKIVDKTSKKLTDEDWSYIDLQRSRKVKWGGNNCRDEKKRQGKGNRDRSLQGKPGRAKPFKQVQFMEIQTNSTITDQMFDQAWYFTHKCMRK